MKEQSNINKANKAKTVSSHDEKTINNSTVTKKKYCDKESLLYFYIAMLVQKSELKLINLIKNYISLNFNKDSKEAIRDLFLLVAILGNSTKNHSTTTKKVYYILLKELIIEYYPIVFKFLFIFPPNYGPLINFKKMCSENMVDNQILDIFKLSINIIEEIDKQILIDELNIDLPYDNLMLFDLKVINTNGNNLYFIEILKDKLSVDEVININILIFENIFPTPLFNFDETSLNI